MVAVGFSISLCKVRKRAPKESEKAEPKNRIGSAEMIEVETQPQNVTKIDSKKSEEAKPWQSLSMMNPNFNLKQVYDEPGCDFCEKNIKVLEPGEILISGK